MKKLPEYIPLRLQPNNIVQSAFLQYNNQHIDVSNTHGVFCHDPFIVGIWSKEILNINNAKLLIHSEKKQRFAIELSFKKRIQLNQHTLFLFSIKSIQTNLSGKLLLQYLFYRIKPKQGSRLYRLYAALYSFPRKIILTSFSSTDHTNFFPMDFQGFVEEENIVLLGLRNTNITLQKIIQQKNFSIADVDLTTIKPIYQLGKHHSSQTLDFQQIDFQLKHTTKFNIPFPEFASAFKELTLIEAVNLGSHTLLIAKVVHQTSSTSNYNLYHISQFEYSCNKYYRQFVID